MLSSVFPHIRTSFNHSVCQTVRGILFLPTANNLFFVEQLNRPRWNIFSRGVNVTVGVPFFGSITYFSFIIILLYRYVAGVVCFQLLFAAVVVFYTYVMRNIDVFA